MNGLTRFFQAGTLLLLLTGEVAAQEALSLSRQDQKSVPVTAYFPGNAACRGMLIISPGAGGSEKGYQYLGEAMSSMGYLAIVVGHEESRSLLHCGGAKFLQLGRLDRGRHGT